jgi:acyl-CoA synthetase (AMP-forming)/AMP-acid ligase II
VIYRSDLPDVDIPELTLPEYVLAQADERGHHVALVDAATGERLTYLELAAGVRAGAAGLARLGVRLGDVVGMLSHNQPKYPVAVYAALAVGAAITPLNPVLTVEELARQLFAAKATVLISSVAAADKAREVADTAGIEHLYLLGERPGFRSFAELLGTGGEPPEPAIDPKRTVAVLPFSSGTTGVSKGVLLTHRNVVANLAQHRPGWRITEHDVLAAVPPFFHIYGFTIILASALLAGATVVTIPRFEATSYLRTLRDFRVTRAYLAPPMVLALAAVPEDEAVELPSLRYAFCGAAPLDVTAAERAELRLGCLIRQGYGMTEASPGTHYSPDEEFPEITPGSVGKLVPGTEARLVDPGTGADVEPGGTGELLVRGPQVMAGYLDNPAATAETITDGWMRTGDLVRVDDDGLFWIVDRIKELIKYKGYQVAPAELEAVLLAHPDIADAAVVGVPHVEGGEAPKAFVVSRRPVGDTEVLDYVAARVAPYKKVRSIEFVDAIPRSPTGKILRRVLRSR